MGSVVSIECLKPDVKYDLIQTLIAAERKGAYNRANGSKVYRGIDERLIDFMAEIYPNEGSNLMLGQFPKNTTRITALELCLHTSQSASTTITESQGVANITETTYTSYARQALATATWGATAAGTGATGRKTTYSTVTFPTVGVTGAVITGFFIGWDTGAGGTATPTVAVMQANFDDTTAATVSTNDVINLTPYMQLNP